MFCWIQRVRAYDPQPNARCRRPEHNWLFRLCMEGHITRPYLGRAGNLLLEVTWCIISVARILRTFYHMLCPQCRGCPNSRMQNYWTWKSVLSQKTAISLSSLLKFCRHVLPYTLCWGTEHFTKWTVPVSVPSGWQLVTFCFKLLQIMVAQKVVWLCKWEKQSHLQSKGSSMNSS